MKDREAIEEKINSLMQSGVKIPLSDGIIISQEVKIGIGSEILPGTIIRGNTVIGNDCIIGPNSYIEDSEIGCGATVRSSYVMQAKIGDKVNIGPFSHIRPNSEIKEGVKIGDFVEVKNSVIGERTSIAHLTYIGDSDIGKDCNFGCGVAVANYDGKNKSRTQVGDNVFVGCHTSLISPVKLGERAYTAAGSVITQDVPDCSLAIARSRQINKSEWDDKR